MNSLLGAVFTVIAVAAFAALLVLTLTVPASPLCIRRHVAAEVEAPRLEPEPLPKVPRDTSRTYPRPKGSRSKLNRVCPVCGTGRETGDLDRRVLGWPAHRTCAEWLGGWQPARPAPPPFNPDKALIGYVEQGQGGTHISVSGSPGAQVNVGDRNRQYGSFPIASKEDLAAAQEMARNGMATVDEVRQRLERQIIASFSVPPGVLEEHTHKVGDPLPAVRCACGAQFIGTPDYLRTAMEMHRRVGCRAQSSSSAPA